MERKRMGEPLPSEVVIAQAAEALAEVSHAVRRGICEAFGSQVPMPWGQLDMSQKDSAIRAAIAAMQAPAASPPDDASLEERVQFSAQRALVAALTQ